MDICAGRLPTTAWARTNVNGGCRDSFSLELEEPAKEEDEGYVDLLVNASLFLLVSKDFPREVRRQGVKMLEHLLKFRREEFSSSDLLKFTSEEKLSRITYFKERNNHEKSLLLAATNSYLRSLLGDEERAGRHEAEGPVDTTTVPNHMPSPYMPFLRLRQRSSALGGQIIDFSAVLDHSFWSSSTPLYTILPNDFFNLEGPDFRLHSPRLEAGLGLCHFGLGMKAEYMSEHNTLIGGLESDESSHGSSSNSLSCTSSPGLSFDTEVDHDGNELEVQRLMSIDIFDYHESVDQDGTDRTNFPNKFDDIIHPRMRCSNGIVPYHRVRGCLLLVEHNILCEAFDVVTSCLRTEQYKGVLHCLLKPLNKIWIQSEWRSTFLHYGFGLTCLLSDHFLELVYNIVKFCENELNQSAIESIKMQSCDLHSLLRLILPTLLQLLQCIHSLWKGQISGSLSEQLESARNMISVENFQQNKTSKFVEEIRLSGYKVIGLSLSIEGAFPDLMNFSSFNVAIFEELGSMEFRHLSKLIRLIFIPLVTNCPCESWKESMLNLLRPLLNHCEDLLYNAWFSLMHHNRAEVPYYFGQLSGSAEKNEKFEDALLLEFTREVSHLLGVLSSPESNNVPLEYLLTHGCLWSLRMSLFGYWVDGEATKSAISFCLAMSLMGGEKHNAGVENNFTYWLVKQKEDLRAKALCVAPMEFNGEWNWEFEDEFQRYLPVYFDMLHEVDAMDYTVECDCSDWNVLLQKLKPEFRSKYAVNSTNHPYLKEISRMQERKFRSVTQVRHYKQMYDLLSKLITLKPYIKGSDQFYTVIERLEENFEIQSTFDAYEVDQSVSPLMPDPGDFAPHLKPYARFYIETTLKTSTYGRAELQIHLHEDYDNYLASGRLDSYIQSHVSEDFSDEDVKTYAVPQEYSDLNHDLIKLSLKRRAQIVHMHHQLFTYSKCLRDLHQNESILLKDRLLSLMSELSAEGFFDIDSNSVNWENECFSKLVEKFNIEIFTGHSLPRCYTIQGIIVVAQTSNKLIGYLPQFWRETRYYDHEYYNIVREPLKKVRVLIAMKIICF
uniref:Exportin-5 C-terminal domain-containing protein n=1 Tax=Leersia perrieri TaxID=77586 RepID=A0A0D9XSG1_9ORYZ